MMSPVTSSLGSAEVPVARRASTPGWRDPRLWVGVAIVAASVLLGARVLAQADRSVSVWAARAELPAGGLVSPEDLVARRVRFLDSGDAELYLRADQPLPDVRALIRPVAAGELVPVAALGEAAGSGLLTVPLSVPALAVPPDVGPGALVDVWVTTENDGGRRVSRPMLTEVVVLAAPAQRESFGVAGDRQLVLGVDDDQAEALGKTLAAVGTSSITVVGRG
jgi:hypothetical protein